MLTHEENDLLTMTGPDTPMGDLYRRFWLPVMLAEELPTTDCDPVRVHVLGERLVAFKDTSGPSINILLKLMAIVSLVFAPVFVQVTPLIDLI